MAVRPGRRSLLAGSNLSVSDTSSPTQPLGGQTVGGFAQADVDAFDLHTDYSTKPNGAVPATGDEGVAIVLNPSTGVAAMSVDAGRLVAPTLPGDASGKASYLQQALPGVSRMGCEFGFSDDTGTTFGSVTLVIWDQIIPEPYSLPNSPCHLTITPGTWGFSVVTNNTTVDSVASGTFATPLKQDWVPGTGVGTVYRLEVSLYGDTAVFKLPDGTTQAVKDSRIAAVTKAVACWEFFRNGTQDQFMSIRRAWADTTPTPLDYGTVVGSSMPVGWWRGDGTAEDVVPGGTPGVLTNGATYGTGIVPTSGSQAFSLDGVNDYVRVADQPKLRIAAPLTVEAWVRPTTVSAGYHAIAGTVNTLIERGVANFTLYTTGPGTVTGASTVVAGQLYHVVATWGGGVATLYVNGKFDAGQAYTSTTVATDGFRVGSYDGASEFFDGSVAEVAFYGRALSAGEVVEHYLAGTYVAAPPPATASGSVTLGGATTAQGAASAITGVVTLSGAPAGQARPSTTGTLTLGGTATGQARPTTTGTITLDGTLGAPTVAASTTGTLTLGGALGAPTVAAGAAGTLTLGATTTPTARPTAAGTLTLGGAVTAVASVSTTGAIILGGTVGAPTVAASVVGTIVLGGAAAAIAVATVAGAISLSGTPTAQAAATVTGTLTLSGTATGSVPGVNTAAGTITLAGTAAPTARPTVLGSVTLSGAPAATARPTVGGVIVLGGTATGGINTTPATASGAITLSGAGAAKPVVAAAGTIVLGGAVTARVPATAAGLITLSGIANAHALGALRDITLTVGPATVRGLSATAASRRRLGVSFQAPRHLGALTATRQLVGAAAARSLTATLED